MTDLRVREEVLLTYMTMAPLPLAFERSIEGALYRDVRLERPVLDIGCGEGLFAKMVFSDKIDTGIDPARRELDRARELDAYHELIECAGDAIPKADGAYRTIFSNSVLEHIPDVEPVLREARRLLAPGGSFCITVPTDDFERYTVGSVVLDALGLDGAARGFRGRFNSFWRHYHAYPLERWQELARRSGFRVVDAFTYDPRRICLLNDVLVPFSLAGFLLKRLTNRWTILPALRRIVLFPPYVLARGFLRDGNRAERGGLAFLRLTGDGGR